MTAGRKGRKAQEEPQDGQSAPASSSQPDPGSVEAKTARIVAAMWVKNKPTITERVAALRKACNSLRRTGSIPPVERDEAVSAAHKLAGVLGMFGFPEGTDAAREIELMLEGDALPKNASSDVERRVVALERILR